MYANHRKETQMTRGPSPSEVWPVHCCGTRLMQAPGPLRSFAVICVHLRLNLRHSLPAGHRHHDPDSQGPVIGRTELGAVSSPRILTGSPEPFGSIDDRP